MSGGVIAGIVVGFVFLAAIFVIVIVILLRRGKKTEDKLESMKKGALRTKKTVENLVEGQIGIAVRMTDPDNIGISEPQMEILNATGVDINKYGK